MAIRLSKAFGGSAESWLIQQTQYDLWQAMQKMVDFLFEIKILTCPSSYLEGITVIRNTSTRGVSNKFTMKVPHLQNRFTLNCAIPQLQLICDGYLK